MSKIQCSTCNEKLNTTDSTINGETVLQCVCKRTYIRQYPYYKLEPVITPKELEA